MKYFIFILLYLNLAHARLLDKTLAIYGEKIITLSQVKRIQSNLVARNKISGVIYKKTKLSVKEISELLIQRQLIRNKLETIGYIISDEQVESQIKTTEQRLGVDRKALLQFLKSYDLTFDEYFILIRQSIEFNLFIEKIIRPLVSISEQEVKQAYSVSISRKGASKSHLYHLIDFYINKKYVPKNKYKRLIPDLKKFQKNGTWPKYLRKMETSVLQDIEEHSLNKKMKKVISRTPLQTFTTPIYLNNQIHIFFVKGKTLTDSQEYLDQKPKIQNILFQKKVTKLTSAWYAKEKEKHYIKTYY